MSHRRHSESTTKAHQPAPPLTASQRDSVAIPQPGRLAAFSMRSSWILRDVLDAGMALLLAEREAGTFFNLVPVAIGAGILAYFAAPSEPMFPVVAASAFLVLLFAVRLRHRGTVFVAATTLGLLLTGMTAAQLRTLLVGGPVIGGQITAKMTGRVLWRDLNSRGSFRYLIRPLAIEGLERSELPKNIRLSASARHEGLVPGQLISGLARIGPYSGAYYPGGYDFHFINWYRGLGGNGYFMGTPRPGEGSWKATAYERWIAFIGRVRLAIAERIKRSLSGEPAAVAIALVTGDRTGMSDSVQESLRRSGLAHILAISGLHMALVTMTVFWAVRFGLSFLPNVSLHYPIRKWAACGGLAAATVYLVISGTSVATQRAWIMLAVMMLAIMADRRALTMRNVVLAATIILLMSPESLLQPGFQMSFAAAGALIAAYAAYNRRRQKKLKLKEPWSSRYAFAIGVPKFMAGLLMTSLIAGLATAPFAAWHFHRVAPFGLASNLLAMPIVSLAVMPLALLGILLMPYGLEGLALQPLGNAIEMVIAVSSGVNTHAPWSGSTGILAQSFLGIVALALVLLLLFHTKLRLLSIAPLVAVWAMHSPALPPDIVVSQDGRAVAVRDAENRLALPYASRNRFVTDIWLAAWSGNVAGKTDRIVTDCDRDLCTIRTPLGIRVAIVYAPDRIQQACAYAHVLIAPRLWWINCHDNVPHTILKRADFERFGTHLLHFRSAGQNGDATAGQLLHTDGGQFGVEIKTTLSVNERPWNHARLNSLTIP